MARRGWRKKEELPGDPSDPDGLTAWMLRYLEACQVRGFTENTVRARQVGLGYFVTWAHDRGLRRPHGVTRPILQAYQRTLFYYRQKNGRPLSASTQSSRLVAVRMFFQWLTKENVLLANPASDLDLPRQVRSIPRHVLTPEEAETILALPDVDDPLGLRDRAILETLYSTGLRRMEVQALKVHDLDHHRGTVSVHEGKGRKSRTVPIGERALAWCDKYVREARPALVYGPDEGVLFLTRMGESILETRLSQMVRRYVRRADLGKDGSCHLWRHTAATLLLEGGADLRHVQEILGHAEVTTTQIYTRVSVRQLKEVHTRAHPAATLERRRDLELEDAELPEDLDGPAE